MIFLNNLLALLFLIEVINCFGLQDFCRINKYNCIGKYDNKYRYTESCDKMKCLQVNRHVNQCSEDYCSTKTTSCDILLNIDFMIGTLNFDVFQNFVNFNKFASEVSNCQVNYTLVKANEVCLKSRNCFLREPYYRRLTSPLKRTECPCLDYKLNFKCGEYCAKDSTTCESLLKGAYDRTVKFESCKNDFIIL